MPSRRRWDGPWESVDVVRGGGLEFGVCGQFSTGRRRLRLWSGDIVSEADVGRSSQIRCRKGESWFSCRVGKGSPMAHASILGDAGGSCAGVSG